MLTDFETVASAVKEQLAAKNWTLVTAESCTGGLLSAAITSIPGISAYFDRGFITYSNLAKSEMLGVSADTIAQFGAVSEETVRAMASGALLHSHADVSLAITGVAGPDGGSDKTPVGTVWIGLAWKEGAVMTSVYHFTGDRSAVRKATVHQALQMLIALG